jgi:hypothetical protein
VTPVIDSSAPAADRRRLVEPLTLSLVVGAIAAVMLATHRAGHWWGDDWALYIRQADGLVSGHPRRVLAENEFTVTMSSGPAFSPPLYPWGFAIALAPFVAVWGPDIDRLAIVPVLSACAFACAWYVLARCRIGVMPAMVGVVAVTLTPLLVGWTELIQSEWTFMAVATWALVALDRAVSADRLAGAAARWTTLAGLGLWTAAAFSVRREGLALVAAIGMAQLAALVGRWRREGRFPVDRRLVAQIMAPHAVAGATVWLLQVVLPTTVIPRYSGTSPWKIWEHRWDHVDHLLEIVGLKRPWEQDPTVFTNATVGWVVAGVFFATALPGLVWALTRRADLHLAVYAVVAFVIGASFRVPVNRYLATVAPLLLLFALMVVARSARSGSRPWVAGLVTTAAVAAIAAGNVANAHLRIDRASEFAAAGSVEWGPTHPDAVEMFDEVRERTDPDDVVAAPKARAMTWATGRLAVQADDYRPVPDLDVLPDLALVVTEPGTEIHRTLLADETYERTWSNPRFSIFEPTG